MGTEITLELGGMTLDWSKNSRGSDHGMLFQPSDRKRMPSEQIDYEYYERTGEDPGPMEMCFCRPLKDTVARLELLGFTMEYVRAEYEACVEQKCEELAAIWEGEYRTATDLDPGLMRFEEFCTFATARPVHALNDTAVSGIDAESEKKIQGRFSDPQVLRRLPGFALHEWDAYSERSFFGNLIGFLHPYSALRVLAENAQNLDTNLLW